MQKELEKLYSKLTPKERKEEIILLKKEIKKTEKGINCLKECLEFLRNM